MELIDRSAIPNYALWGTMTVGDKKQPAKMRFVLWDDLMAMPVVNTDDLVIHGKWEDVYLSSPSSYVGTCSVCGKSNDIPPPMLAHYCPNCGSKMDMKP